MSVRLKLMAKKVKKQNKRRKQRSQWEEKQWQTERRFWADYGFYLKSENWQKKREAVLKRARFLCEVCQRREATQVHHLSYMHVYDEPLSDLQAVCSVCHARIHSSQNMRKLRG